MSKSILIIFIIIFTAVSCAQSKDEKVNQKNSSVKFELRKILTNDTLAYEQFLMTKRCFCRENYLTLQELRNNKNPLAQTLVCALPGRAKK